MRSNGKSKMPTGIVVRDVLYVRQDRPPPQHEGLGRWRIKPSPCHRGVKAIHIELYTCRSPSLGEGVLLDVNLTRNYNSCPMTCLTNPHSEETEDKYQRNILASPPQKHLPNSLPLKVLYGKVLHCSL